MPTQKVLQMPYKKSDHPYRMGKPTRIAQHKVTKERYNYNTIDGHLFIGCGWPRFAGTGPVAILSKYYLLQPLHIQIPLHQIRQLLKLRIQIKTRGPAFKRQTFLSP